MNTNVFTEKKQATSSDTGVDTDGNGDTTVTVSDLREIEEVADVNVQAADGYVANVQSVSGNQVTVRIFESAGSAAALSAVTSGSSVTDLETSALGY